VSCQRAAEGPADSGRPPPAESGLPFAESGLPFAESGLPFAESGLPFAESGLPFAESGLRLADSGLPSISDQAREVGELTPPHGRLQEEAGWVPPGGGESRG
jgi:hypothetical protein